MCGFSLRAKSAHFFSRGPASKYFGFCVPFGLCHDSTLPLCTRQPQTRHKERACLCSEEALFKDTTFKFHIIFMGHELVICLGVVFYPNSVTMWQPRPRSADPGSGSPDLINTKPLALAWGNAVVVFSVALV